MRLASIPVLNHVGMSIPQSEGCFLNYVKDGGNGNDNDDTIPKEPCKCITRNLQMVVIQDLV